MKDYEKQMIGMSDIVEGSYELAAMQLSVSTGEPSEYPALAPLNIDVDTQKLMADFLSCRRLLSSDYLIERKDHLVLPLEDTQNLLSQLGFLPETYEVFGMQEIGSDKLLDIIPSFTRQVLSQLGPICRAHYVLAHPTMDIKPHVDCYHYREHGFRIHIPIFNSAFCTFYVDEKKMDYEMKPGKVWFVNNAIKHSAENPTEFPRLSIVLQMMSDVKLFDFLKDS